MFRVAGFQSPTSSRRSGGKAGKHAEARQAGKKALHRAELHAVQLKQGGQALMAFAHFKSFIYNSV